LICGNLIIYYIILTDDDDNDDDDYYSINIKKKLKIDEKLKQCKIKTQ